MTVSTTHNRISYNTDGITSAFPVTFQFFDPDDLEVVLVDGTTGGETLLTLGVDYGVAQAQPPDIRPSVGTITTTIVYATGDRIVITRQTDLTQEIDFVPNEDMPSEEIEDGLDRATLQAQDAQGNADPELGRAVLVPTGEPSIVIPPIPTRASNLLGFDAQGDPIASGGEASVTVSEAMTPVVQAQTLQEARVLLNLARPGNILLNGGFSIAQDGAVFAGADVTDQDETLDRWILLTDGANKFDVIQIFTNAGFATGDGGGPNYSAVITPAVGNPPVVKGGLFQILEHLEVNGLQGETVTLSFTARTTLNPAIIGAAILQSTDTIDAPAFDPVTDWGSFGTGIDTYGNNWTLIAQSLTNLVVDTNTMISVTGTFPVQNPGPSNVGVLIWVDSNEAEGAELRNVQLNVGTERSELDIPQQGVELSRCQRFRWKTFDQIVKPAPAAGRDGMMIGSAVSGGVNDGLMSLDVRYPVTMWRAPNNVTIYNPEPSIPAEENWAYDFTTVGGYRMGTAVDIGDAAFGIDGNPVAPGIHPGSKIGLHLWIRSVLGS